MYPYGIRYVVGEGDHEYAAYDADLRVRQGVQARDEPQACKDGGCRAKAEFGLRQPVLLFFKHLYHGLILHQIKSHRN